MLTLSIELLRRCMTKFNFSNFLDTQIRTLLFLMNLVFLIGIVWGMVEIYLDPTLQSNFIGTGFILFMLCVCLFFQVKYYKLPGSQFFVFSLFPFMCSSVPLVITNIINK